MQVGHVDAVVTHVVPEDLPPEQVVEAAKVAVRRSPGTKWGRNQEPTPIRRNAKPSRQNACTSRLIRGEPVDVVVDFRVVAQVLERGVPALAVIGLPLKVPTIRIFSCRSAGRRRW